MAEPLYETSETGGYGAEDIAAIAALLRFALPEDYLSFVRQHGDVSFGEDGVTFDVAWRRVDGKDMAADEDEDFEDDFMLLVLSDPEQIIDSINYLHALDEDFEPLIASHLFPFTTGVSSEYLLMSLAPDDYGQVYLYFPSDDPWGEGDNNYLGFVAASFTDFIENRIRPYV